MNLRIPLIVFAVASVMTASTAIAAMSMQKAYSIEATVRVCSHDKCFSGEGAQDKCNAWREAELKKQQEEDKQRGNLGENEPGFGTVASCVKQD